MKRVPSQDIPSTPRDTPKHAIFLGGRQRLTSRLMSRVLIAALIFAGLWANATDLPAMAYAKGKIIPLSLPRPVEHIDGGEIAEILVREAEYVAKGKPILRLSPIFTKAESERLQLRTAALKRNIARLEIVVGVVEGRLKTNDVRMRWGFGFRLQSQLDAFTSRLALLDGRIEKNKDALALRTLIHKNASQQENTIQKETDAANVLKKRGLISGTQLSQYEIRRLEGEGNRLRSLTSLMNTKLNLDEAVRERDEFVATTRDGLIAEIEALRDELGLVFEAVTKNNDRLSRLVIYSPVDGVVEKLHVTGPGEVIAPGDIVAVVLPTHDRLIAEVHLQPDDIGHIEVGDDVELKPTSFNAKRYGVQLGEVLEISPNSQLNEQNEAYFKVRIAMTDVRGGDGSLDRRLSAGMEVNASIITDVRSVLDYVVSPIFSPIENAFHER